MRHASIAEADTVGGDDWPVDPDLVQSTAVHVEEERGAVVVAPPRSGRGVGLAIVAALVIASLVAALLWALARRQSTPAAASQPPPATTPAAPTGGNAAVPSLVGDTLLDAQQQLAARSLPIEVRRTPSRRPKDVVLAQSPAAGARLSQGDKVLLVVAAPRTPASGTKSTPPAAKSQVSVPTVTVPTVTGLSVSAATAALEHAGLKVEETKVSSGKPAGTVVTQSPATGSHADRGSIVRIEVAVPAGPPKVVMPHVVGLSVGQATAQLRARGLHVTVEQTPSSETAGTVLAETPVGGAQLRRGMTVTLRVAAAPAKIDVPDVTGLDVASARQQLEDAGFSVQVDTQPVTDASQDGIVIDESPAGGSSATKGATVTLTVGQAASQ